MSTLHKVFNRVRLQSSSPPFAWLSPRRCFNRRHWNRYPCSSAMRNSCSCCPPRCHETAEDYIICAINGHWRETWWVLCLVSPNGPMGRTNSSSWQIEWGQLHKAMDFNCQICAHIKQATAFFSYYWSSLVMMSKKPCLLRTNKGEHASKTNQLPGLLSRETTTLRRETTASRISHSWHTYKFII